MTIQEYIAEVQKQFATGYAREHTYRPALQQLLSAMLPHLIVSNEPARQSCGAPDYILMRDDDNNPIPVAFVEAKDIGDSDLAGRKEHKEQFDRYRSSLDNIVFTDYLDFHFYEKTEFVDSVRIAEVKGNKIVACKDNFDKFKHLIEHFGNAAPQTITSSSKLAKIMAGKARLLANVIEKVLVKDNDEYGNLKGQMDAFKDILIHDISPKDFADVYAQTITYGMFAARLHDPTPDTFSRGEAATLIPKTNPFLRQLFQYVAGYDLDERISWIVDDLAETFRATDMPKIMSGFGKRTEQNDPMIHFYEDFLSAYDPSLRKSRGVWYTPQAVVNFIVRAVDDILQKEFHLPMGLADHSKIAIEQSVEQSRDNRYSDKKKKTKVEYHRVQILDPATGTGTFLAEVVSQIYAKFQGQTGMWQGYVDEHLLPRLNGFELLMASYAMAHLKIDWMLTETGYKSVDNKRLRIFLTNSLEEYHKDTGTLFAQFLAREANGANAIKRDTPVMVVLGNPPYNGESKNNNKWISNLVKLYKYDDNGHKISNTKWVNNDYVKFIRLAQYYVDKNNEGILAYITDNSFLDSLTFKGMRYSLLNSFDKIYIFNLHGESRSNETQPSDENVFDILQGVSITLCIKKQNGHKHKIADLLYSELFGSRKKKYEHLLKNSISSVKWKKLSPNTPGYYFVPKEFRNETSYEKGFKIDDLFVIGGVGICSKRDKVAIQYNKSVLQNVLSDFGSLAIDKLKEKYPNEQIESRDKKTCFAVQNIKDYGLTDAYVKPISFRPFDVCYTYHTNKSKGFLAYPVYNVMQHLHYKGNFGLVVGKQCTSEWRYAFLTKYIADLNLIATAAKFGGGYVYPLYLYDDNTSIDGSRRPNLKTEIVDKIAKNIGLTFEPEKSDNTAKFAPIDLLDYIYAVLHSPAYREQYKESLKIDFPRVPHPTSADEFRRLARLGSELRQIHLMEHSELDRFLTQYPVAGNNTVCKVRWKALSEDVGRVWINKSQYFDNVPLTAWEFYIGGYQPAQKWLKDRANRVLGFDDIRHYQRIIKALVMTDEIMKKIDC